MRPCDIQKVWSHGIPFGSGFKCYYCNKAFKGGGATRFREHLAGITGNVAVCEKVPKDVRKCLSESRIEGKQTRAENKARKQRVEDEIAQAIGVADVVTAHDYAGDIPSDEEGQYQFVLRRSIRETKIKSDVASATSSRCGGGYQRRLDSMFPKQAMSKRRGGFDIDLARSRASVQPRIDVTLKPEVKDKLGKAWSKFFHANDVAGRKANCPYFRAAIKLTQQLGEGVPCPAGEAIDSSYLESNYEELKQDMKEWEADWDEYKVTLMCDSWTGQKDKSIINFMVYCNEKMFFHKSIDATGEIQNASFLYDQIRKVIVDEIGQDRVMQIVTDNGANYKKACQQITRDFQKIRVLNLIVADHLEKEKPTDPFREMIDLALFDHCNPITKWLNESMAESDPLLDEKDGKPSRELSRLVHEASVLEKRKHNNGAHGKRKKGASQDEEGEFDENESESDEDQHYNKTWESDSEDGANDDGDTDDDQPEEAANSPRPRKRQVLNQERIQVDAHDGTTLIDSEEDNDARPRRACRDRTKDIHTLLGHKK